MTICIFSACDSLSREDLIAELLIPEHQIEVQGKLGNRISDPTYIRAYADGNLIFQCRMADKVKFLYKEGTLTILSNCNLDYEYDRIQKSNYKNVKIVYKNFE